MTRLIYLAQPIDNDCNSNAEWSALRDALPAFQSWFRGVVTYSPARAFAVGWDTAPVESIEKVNRAAILYSDGLVAILPKGVQTVGVPRELEFAKSIGHPTAVLTDLENSFSLAGEARFPLTADGLAAALEHVRDSERPEPVVFGDEIAVCVGEDGTLPTRSHSGDAGFDCYVSEDVTIQPGEFADVPIDLRVAMPESIWLRIVGRSSTLRNRRLLVVEGVIDPGFRGTLFNGVMNMSEQPVTIKAGERIAQAIPHTNLAPDITLRQVSVDEFEAIPHDGRGDGGFGSSGV